RRDRIFLCRQDREDALDQPSRGATAHLRLGRLADPDPDPGRGLSRLSPRGRRRPGAALVLLRAAAADHRRLVVVAPPANHSRRTDQERRSIMKLVTRRIALAAAALAALALSAKVGVKALEPLKVDFSDETVGAEPKSFLSVVGV